MGYIRGQESENILENKENAEFVCRAVNSHEALLSWVKSCRSYVDRVRNKSVLTSDDLESVLETIVSGADEAIAQAEGR